MMRLLDILWTMLAGVGVLFAGAVTAIALTPLPAPKALPTTPDYPEIRKPSKMPSATRIKAPKGKKLRTPGKLPTVKP